jgi:hypothetical protein
MDILYYSNYCPNSKKVLEYISKNGLIDHLNCICLDRRSIDPQSGQILIHLENGKCVMMPPGIHGVPAMLIVKENYRCIYAQEIISYLNPMVSRKISKQTLENGEPIAMPLAFSPGGSNIVSDKFTYYNVSPDEYMAKGKGAHRQLYNYVKADHENQLTIQTPPDSYRPDKVDEESMQQYQEKRNDEVKQQREAGPFGF